MNAQQKQAQEQPEHGQHDIHRGHGRTLDAFVAPQIENALPGKKGDVSRKHDYRYDKSHARFHVPISFPRGGPDVAAAARIDPGRRTGVGGGLHEPSLATAGDDMRVGERHGNQMRRNGVRLTGIVRPGRRDRWSRRRNGVTTGVRGRLRWEWIDVGGCGFLMDSETRAQGASAGSNDQWLPEISAAVGFAGLAGGRPLAVPAKNTAATTIRIAAAGRIALSTHIAHAL